MGCRFETGTVVVRGRTYIYEATERDGGWDVRFHRETPQGTIIADHVIYWDMENVDRTVALFREEEGSYLDDIAAGYDRS